MSFPVSWKRAARQDGSVQLGVLPAAAGGNGITQADFYVVTDESGATHSLAVPAGTAAGSLEALFVTALALQPAVARSATYSSMPRRWTGFHWDSLVLVGNALTKTQDASQAFASYAYQTAASATDSFTNGFCLKANGYTLDVLGITGNNRAKVDWYVDNVLQISGQDWYAATPGYNNLKTGAITVATDGYHVLKAVVNGKNASSADYNLLFSRFSIYPAAD